MLDSLSFAKYQALGNDFIVLDARDDPNLVDDEEIASMLSNRHFGAGADDVIFLTASNVADFGMRIHTPFSSSMTSKRSQWSFSDRPSNGIRPFPRA
jgi:diaminopimelate epimerase